ncbi:MAG: hypothetical protein AB7P14_05005 [Blastocatellales bacterium]
MQNTWPREQQCYFRDLWFALSLARISYISVNLIKKIYNAVHYPQHALIRQDI